MRVYNPRNRRRGLAGDKSRGSFRLAGPLAGRTSARDLVRARRSQPGLENRRHTTSSERRRPAANLANRQLQGRRPPPTGDLGLPRETWASHSDRDRPHHPTHPRNGPVSPLRAWLVRLTRRKTKPPILGDVASFVTRAWPAAGEIMDYAGTSARRTPHCSERTCPAEPSSHSSEAYTCQTPPVNKEMDESDPLAVHFCPSRFPALARR